MPGSAKGRCTPGSTGPRQPHEGRQDARNTAPHRRQDGVPAAQGLQVRGSHVLRLAHRPRFPPQNSCVLIRSLPPRAPQPGRGGESSVPPRVPRRGDRGRASSPPSAEGPVRWQQSSRAAEGRWMPLPSPGLRPALTSPSSSLFSASATGTA